MSAVVLHPENIHPSLWRGSQLARGRERCVGTGHESLSAELPGGGWPQGVLSEMLLQQAGIGELRLMAPALRQLGKRPLMLVQPPHMPQPAAFAYWGLDPSSVVLLRPPKIADALWAAEQALRAGTCGAVLLWQTHVRQDALRRLHLAAQMGGESLFFLFRPLAAATGNSPAPLRLSITPVADGVELVFVKRRGPQRDAPLFVPLSPSPNLLSRNASLDRHPSAVSRPRIVSSELVEAGL